MGKRASRTLGAVVVGLVLWGGAICGGAWAGRYHVYSCRMPDGEAAPVDGWSGSVSQANDRTTETCATGGGLVAALEAGHAHPADTDLATWAFGAPGGETLGAATVWRAGDTAGGTNENASYLFWLAGSAGAETGQRVFDRCTAVTECSAKGNFVTPLAAQNRVEVPSAALHTPNLSLTASCGSVINEYGCPSGAGDENGEAAIVELFAADLTLTEEDPPTIRAVAGPLAEASTVSGTSDVTFTATDPGSGVYETVFEVDGQTVASAIPAANGGHCHDVGQTTDGLAAFLYTQPCPPSESVDVPFDTKALTDGSHHLVVEVTDAAGNSTPAVDREVTVANDPEGEQTPPGGGSGGGGAGSGGSGGAGSGSGGGTGPGGAGGESRSTGPTGAAAGATAATAGAAGPESRGAANGGEASDQAALSARWRGAAGTRMTAGFGRAETLEGRLTAPGGRPIAGARIDVGEVPAYTGAHLAGLPAARTDADGRFRVRLPRRLPSGAVRLGYRSHLGDTRPVATRTLTLAVRPKIRLRIAPRVSSAGHRIRFTGRLEGGPIPPGGKQLVLEGRSAGGRWLQFDVVRTDARGAFHASYRFRFPGPISYGFRALSTYEADFPFLAGGSSVVGVLER